jgi:hypothetical protein
MVRLNQRCDCPHRLYCYHHLMSSKIAYDVYRGTNDRTLRLATIPGAGLPPLEAQRLGSDASG